MAEFGAETASPDNDSITEGKNGWQVEKPSLAVFGEFENGLDFLSVVTESGDFSYIDSSSEGYGSTNVWSTKGSKSAGMKYGYDANNAGSMTYELSGSIDVSDEDTILIDYNCDANMNYTSSVSCNLDVRLTIGGTDVFNVSYAEENNSASDSGTFEVDVSNKDSLQIELYVNTDDNKFDDTVEVTNLIDNVRADKTQRTTVSDVVN